ncbi:tyrosine-type recombinase/integrase [Thiorhodovibrio winogradskyi]|uniref:tyrosine-type recombinase/integrase n=1 Tax=Thiorhodovibrio winogradskyi TaxID=77007 RepID=UPI002E2C4DBA|nr:tyrosine-type recombinase/integrase [Thiorhodovibrio winogradskyi]
MIRANNSAWRKALVRAGIADFRWHDLRYTRVSWMVQAGVPLHILQELGGWETPEMVRRYAHLSAAHLAEYARRIETETSAVASMKNAAHFPAHPTSRQKKTA